MVCVNIRFSSRFPEKAPKLRYYRCVVLFAEFPVYLTTLMVSAPSEAPEVEQMAWECQHTDFVFTLGNSQTLELEEDADMIFIDTLHQGWLLEIELSRFALRAKRFLVLHDTHLFAYNDEVSNTACHNTSGGCTAGLMPAVNKFLDLNRDNWGVMVQFSNNNGLTVLERLAPQL